MAVPTTKTQLLALIAAVRAATQEGEVTQGDISDIEEGIHDLAVFGEDFLVVATYDFGADGGGVGEIDSGVAIPDNAVVLQIVSDEITTLTSSGSGATIEAKLGTTAAGDGTISDVKTADGSNGGLIDEGTNYLKKTSAVRNINFEIKVEDITAGKVAYIIMFRVDE